MTKKDNIIIRINADLKRDFIEQCRLNGDSQTEVLTRAIKNYLKRRNK